MESTHQNLLNPIFKIITRHLKVILGCFESRYFFEKTSVFLRIFGMLALFLKKHIFDRKDKILSKIQFWLEQRVFIQLI